MPLIRPLKTFLDEIKEELSAVTSLNKLQKLGIERESFILSTRKALVKAPPELAEALKKVSNSYGLSRKYSTEGRKIVSAYFDRLEGRSARLERRSPVFAKLYKGTTSWFVEMASFAVIFKGMTEIAERQEAIIDSNLRVTGKLDSLLQKNISAPYEKASVVAKQFNADSEQVTKAAIEFANRFGRGATMRDLQRIGSIARFTGQSYEDVWKEITDRSKDMGENFSQAASGVQDVIAAQRDLEAYEFKLGHPRENILGAQEFAEMMKKTRELGKDLPKDSRILNKVVVETLKRVYGVDSKEQKELVAENMAKIVEADPMIAGQLGEIAEKKIKAEADKVIKEYGGDYDKDQAEIAAINKIFGKAYSAQVRSILKAQRQGLSRYSVMMELGSLYSKIPSGMKDALKLTRNFATVGGTSGQAAQEYFEQHGVDPRVIPQLVAMALSDNLDQVAEEVGKLDEDAEARAKKESETTNMVLGRALPWMAEVSGTIRGGWDILTSSPWTKILGGVAALATMKRFATRQHALLLADMATLEAKFYKVAIAKGDTEAAALLKNMGTKGKPSLGRRVVGNKWVQGAVGLAALGGTAYELLKPAQREEEKNTEESLQKMAPHPTTTSNLGMASDIESLSLKMSAGGINNVSRRVADGVEDIRKAEVRNIYNRGQAQTPRGESSSLGDFKPTIEVTNMASVYVQSVAKVRA